MLSDDYILRMIQQGTIVLSRIIGLKKAGDYQEALQEIDQSLEQVLGINKEIIRNMDDESIYKILTKDEQIDIKRLGVIADLYKEEGDIVASQGQPESHHFYLRALNYHLLKYINEEPSQQIESIAKIEDVIKILDITDLPSETLFNLFCYYENMKEFVKASNMLKELAIRPEPNTYVREETISFYKRLLTLDPEELIASGLNIKEIKRKIKEI
jgi:tetratricopeptide (TPR) repeat protein